MVCVLHSVPIALVGIGHLLKQFNEMLSQHQEAHGVKCLVICDFFPLKKCEHREHEAVRVWGMGDNIQIYSWTCKHSDSIRP